MFYEEKLSVFTARTPEIRQASGDITVTAST